MKPRSQSMGVIIALSDRYFERIKSKTLDHHSTGVFEPLLRDQFLTHEKSITWLSILPS